MLAYAGARLLQDDFDLALREMPGSEAVGRLPVIVTAADLGDGLALRCPHCNTVHRLQQNWLGNDHLTRPNDACQGPLQVNPFIAGHGG